MDLRADCVGVILISVYEGITFCKDCSVKMVELEKVKILYYYIWPFKYTIFAYTVFVIDSSPS